MNIDSWLLSFVKKLKCTPQPIISCAQTLHPDEHSTPMDQVLPIKLARLFSLARHCLTLLMYSLDFLQIYTH